MKHFLFTTLFAMCLYLADAGVINLNWPYMDAANNCILNIGDPDGNGRDDIHFGVILISTSSYQNNPNLFNDGTKQLGILFKTVTSNFNGQYQRFMPLYAFNQSAFGQSFAITEFEYKKNVTVPYTYGLNTTFQFTVELVYRDNSGLTTVFSPYNNDDGLFLDHETLLPVANTPIFMVKDVCSYVPINSKRLSGNQSNTKVFPSVFTNEFTIQYEIEEAQEVGIEVFDANGALKYEFSEHLFLPP